MFKTLEGRGFSAEPLSPWRQLLADYVVDSTWHPENGEWRNLSFAEAVSVAREVNDFLATLMPILAEQKARFKQELCATTCV